MSYTMYTPLNVWLDPASVTDVVAYIQNYLSENTIYSEEEIEELIHDYLIAHPELIGGVQSVNGKTGTVVLSASDINTQNNVTIESVLASLSSQISSIASSVATNTSNITGLTGRVSTAETDISELKSNISYVTPEMFGAKGDGVTDDTLAFKAMFNSTYKTFVISNIYKIESDIISDDLFTFNNVDGISIIGGGTLIDGREPPTNTSNYSIFKFIDSKNIIIDLNYTGQEYEISNNSLITTGYTFIELYSCSNVSINATTEYCRQAVQVEIYGSTNTSNNIDICANVKNTGYLASLYNCNTFSIKGVAENFHRICYLAGCSNGKILVNGLTKYSSASPVLLTNNLENGCSFIDVSIIDDGSTFTGEVGILGVAAQTNDSFYCSFNAYIEINENSNGTGANFQGMSGNIINSKINIVDNKLTSQYMTINTARITGTTNGLTLSINTNNDINLGCDCILIDSKIKKLNVVTSKRITLINVSANNVYTSGDGTGSCCVINSALIIPVNSFLNYFNDSEWIAGNNRPSLSSTKLCIMYDTSLNKLLVHQGNYWFELATRGNAIT